VSSRWKRRYQEYKKREKSWMRVLILKTATKKRVVPINAKVETRKRRLPVASISLDVRRYKAS
jgi:hypothetical protein